MGLYNIAEQKGIFNREDTIKYLEELRRLGYRREHLTRLIESLSLFQSQ